MKRFLAHFNFWLLPISWALVIFGLSSMPPQDQPGFEFPPGFDKIAHLGVYGILGLFVFIAFIKETGIPPRIVLVMTVIMVSLYGISDEWHQSFVPGRDVDILDWVADTLGGALGGLAGMFRINRTITPDRSTT